MRFPLAPALALCAAMIAGTASAQNVPCGGSFGSFIADMKREAISRGHDPQAAERFFASARQSPSTLKADRSQGVFKKTFLEFSQNAISSYRINKGRENAQRYASIFRRAQQQYGVQPGVLLAFWALETDYGGYQGDFNTLNSLVTLAHDCRRPELFRPQVFAALSLYEQGDFDPATTTGAWAGEIGMVQMLPEDILHRGVDGDGDGHVTLKTSAPDALMTGARMLHELGWRANEPWLQEVTLPADFDWRTTGLDTTRPVSAWASAGVTPRSGALGPSNLPASILLPQGRKGPAFIAYPNFNVYFEWNKSFVYVVTAAYLATRIEGAPVYNAGNPDPQLSDAQMQALQQKLQARGHDVGGIDGILGAMTRAAVRKEQARLGLPADAWPTVQLLNAL